MEFWGEEVTHDESLNVVIEEGTVLHLSLACLGKPKKENGNESVYLTITVDGKKFVLGTLSTEKILQQQFDLVFDKTFQLSHNWENGTVVFAGYKAEQPLDDYTSGDSDTSDSDSDEDIPLTAADKGKPDTKVKQDEPLDTVKATSSKGKESKQKVKIVEPKKEEKPEEDDVSSDEDMLSVDSDEDDSENESDEDDSDDESDEETPKKAESSKKRAAESAVKTPIPDKKAKVTLQKKDDKNSGGHVATPFPGKKPGKTPATTPNQKTPKSGGSHSCKSCNRTFGSDKALESHSKAKHDGVK